MKNRNSEVLKSFIKYCKEHPDERFWQALRNWSGYGFILVSRFFEPCRDGIIDTFYWENKDE
jgi:hypothetical protein